MKKYLIFYFSIFLNSILLIAQTNTTTDGNWNTGGNWNNGVPADDDVANITHQMILNTDLTIDDGTYTVNDGSIIDVAGGTKYKVDIKGDGYFEVGGNVTIGGDLKAKDNAELVLKGCDTLIVEGKLEFKDNSKLTVEDCAVLIILKDVKFEDDVIVIIDGNVIVSGKLEIKNDAIISGDGNIQVTKETKIKNSSTIFGSNTECNPGPCDYGPGGSLPIELVSFEGILLSNGTVQLEWITATEINNDYFTIERADNNNPFEEIVRIVGAGNSQQKLNYQYTDDSPLAENTYYRLKQTDFDGKFTYSETELVKANPNHLSQGLHFYPNPANQKLTIENTFEGVSNLKIINLSGKLFLQKIIQQEGQFIELDVSALTPGYYFIQQENQLERKNGKFVIVR